MDLIISGIEVCALEIIGKIGLNKIRRAVEER
jgi:hypothetical protein